MAPVASGTPNRLLVNDVRALWTMKVFADSRSEPQAHMLEVKLGAANTAFIKSNQNKESIEGSYTALEHSDISKTNCDMGLPIDLP